MAGIRPAMYTQLASATLTYANVAQFGTQA
jgi:hypothetical protein